MKLRWTVSFMLACYKVENPADRFSMVTSATAVQHTSEIIKTRAEDDVQLLRPQGRPAWLATPHHSGTIMTKTARLGEFGLFASSLPPG